jgi:hypothetical protein
MKEMENFRLLTLIEFKFNILEILLEEINKILSQSPTVKIHYKLKNFSEYQSKNDDKYIHHWFIDNMNNIQFDIIVDYYKYNDKTIKCNFKYGFIDMNTWNVYLDKDLEKNDIIKTFSKEEFDSFKELIDVQIYDEMITGIYKSINTIFH